MTTQPGRWQLACLDMAGTTVSDGGLVERAFTVAIGAAGITPDSPGYERALRIVRETMGQSKIDVFRLLLGDADKARDTNHRFEDAYADLVADGLVSPLPGALSTIRALRAAGIRVALTTGFARATQDALISALGWASEVDIALCPADAGRGRPFPDLVLTAVLRLGVTDVRAVVVAGDTPSDMVTGVRAGAGLVVGVRTGAGTPDELTAAGAHRVVTDIGALPDLLGIPATTVTGPVG